MGEIAIFGLETSYLGTRVPYHRYTSTQKTQAWLHKYLPRPEGTEQ